VYQNLDHVLLHTIQDLKVQFEEAIKPSKDALIANEFIRHAEMDVRVSVVSCISEIVRISAPDDPYEDDQMREFFQVAVGAFESLSCMSGRAYTKAVSILRTISYSQSCVLMLDLRMHDLIHQMFHTFFNVIRASHSNAIFSDMENIMRLIIRDDVDCDESALELAKIILANLKKENQNVSPVAFQLAENTFKKYSNDLEDYLEEAGRCLGFPVEDYAEVVVSLFRDPTPSEDMVCISSCE
ncbi:sister chromatid cohesion protein pds5 homolog b, partial [Phtheirospermum japonicum]